MHPDDGGQVGRGESVAAAEHSERNLPRRGLAFQPAFRDSQDQGGFFSRVYGWYALVVMRRGQLSSAWSVGSVRAHTTRRLPVVGLADYHTDIIAVMRITF
jgi:hypothetical protein